jgi:mannosylglycerate hydrolase
VRAEGQFAVVRRSIDPPQPRTQWCEPPDATQHSSGVVALGPIALLTRGLPEYEVRASAGGSELCLTILRCVGLISRPAGVMSTRPGAAGPELASPEGQCLGRNVVEYALQFDADDRDEVALLRASQDYRCPFLVVGSGVQYRSQIQLDGEVVFSCLKGAEDGETLILRVFNPSLRATTACVIGPVAVERARLDESCGSPLTNGVVEVGAGEITTLRLRAAPAKPTGLSRPDIQRSE